MHPGPWRAQGTQHQGGATRLGVIKSEPKSNLNPKSREPFYVLGRGRNNTEAARTINPGFKAAWRRPSYRCNPAMCSHRPASWPRLAVALRTESKSNLILFHASQISFWDLVTTTQNQSPLITWTVRRPGGRRPQGYTLSRARAKARTLSGSRVPVNRDPLQFSDLQQAGGPLAYSGS